MTAVRLAPIGYDVMLHSLCCFPGPHMSQQLWRTRPVAHLAKRGSECASCGSLDPSPPRASPWELTFISPGPPQQSSTWSLTRPSPRKAVLRFIHEKELLLFREQPFWTHDAWAQHQRPAPEVTRKSPQASSRLACCWDLAVGTALRRSSAKFS